MVTFKQKLHQVKAFAFDIDGVFSNSMQIYPTGELMRQMNAKDGYVVQYALKKGYPVAIISGARCESIRLRFEALGVKDVYTGSIDKMADIKDFVSKYQLSLDQVLYMGDDIPDYIVMQQVGVSACPLDAVDEVKEVADYISDRGAGAGCVRDVVEQTLKLHGRWMETDAFSW